jgi:hypothetical protein
MSTPTPGIPDTSFAARRAGLRWLFHTSLFLAFLTAGGAVLIWPQWMVWDGARAALQQQQDQERKLAARLTAAKSANQEILVGQQKGRSAFSEEQIAEYPGLVRSIAEKQGATVVQVGLVEEGVPRSRSYPALTLASDDRGGRGGEVRPRTVRVVLTGNFKSLYRTIGLLCQQPQLLVPDGWEIAASGGFDSSANLRCDFRGTVFVVEEPSDTFDTGAALGPMVTQAAGGPGG